MSQIVIGHALIPQILKFMRAELKTDTNIIILFYDRKVRYYAQKLDLRIKLEHPTLQVRFIEVSVSEKIKSLPFCEWVYCQLNKLGADRSSLIGCLGGGCLGDVVGFAASTYKRGLRWVIIPSTLLSQVDSSIGGKTAVNHDQLGKNMIGTVHLPEVVFIDTDLLKTLPPREIISGMGEVLKYQLLLGVGLGGGLSRSRLKMIQMCARYKELIVKEDLHETDSEGRIILNLGHTFAHALESASDYTVFRHGEAVYWGLRYAVELSVIRGHMKSEMGDKLNKLFVREIDLSWPLKYLQEETLTIMQSDKKARGGRVRFVLLQAPGKVVIDGGVTWDEQLLALKSLLKRKRRG